MKRTFFFLTLLLLLFSTVCYAVMPDEKSSFYSDFISISNISGKILSDEKNNNNITYSLEYDLDKSRAGYDSSKLVSINGTEYIGLVKIDYSGIFDVTTLVLPSKIHYTNEFSIPKSENIDKFITSIWAVEKPDEISVILDELIIPVSSIDISSSVEGFSINNSTLTDPMESNKTLSELEPLPNYNLVEIDEKDNKISNENINESEKNQDILKNNFDSSMKKNFNHVSSITLKDHVLSRYINTQNGRGTQIVYYAEIEHLVRLILSTLSVKVKQ